MSTRLRVSKLGASLIIRIPETVARRWNVREGSAIEIIPRGDHIVLRKESYDLADMLAQVTADNLHSEQDSGPAQGGEAW